MVESDKSSPTEGLRSALDQALRSGMRADEIEQMVAVTLSELASDTLAAPETPPEDVGVVIYEPGELPEGLIDLPSAAKKYGIKVATLRQWVNRGKLPRCGRVRARAAGGGYIVTVEAEIIHCRDNPQKPWHRKSVTT